MGNRRQARRTWLITLISLVAIPLLLWACDIDGRQPPTPTPTPTPTSGLALPVLPTVDPAHTHEPVPEAIDPRCLTSPCMGHMYLSHLSGISRVSEDGQIRVFTVLHDHPPAEGPDLTNSTIALVQHGFVPGSTPVVEFYLDPTWDLQFDPNEHPGSLPCAIVDPEAEEKLARAATEVVPHLGGLFVGAFPTPSIRMVDCVLQAVELDNQNRLIIGVPGHGIVPATPHPIHHLLPSVTPTPSP